MEPCSKEICDTEECPICLTEIQRIYVMINHMGETGKYHTECLDGWLKNSKNGILVQTPIESINLYENNEKLGNFNITFKEPKVFEVLYNIFDTYDEYEQDSVCDHLCIIL